MADVHEPPATRSEAVVLSYATEARAPSQALAVCALLCGIAGLVPGIGVVLGPVGIMLAHDARRRARRHPDRYAAGGPATAAMILGLVSLALAAVEYWEVRFWSRKTGAIERGLRQ